MRDASFAHESRPNQPPLLIPSTVQRSDPCTFYRSGDSRGTRAKNWACEGCEEERRQGRMTVIVSIGECDAYISNSKGGFSRVWRRLWRCVRKRTMLRPSSFMLLVLVCIHEERLKPHWMCLMFPKDQTCTNRHHATSTRAVSVSLLCHCLGSTPLLLLL